MEKKKIELVDGKLGNVFDAIIDAFIKKLNAVEFTKEARNEFLKRIKFEKYKYEQHIYETAGRTTTHNIRMLHGCGIGVRVDTTKKQR